MPKVEAYLIEMNDTADALLSEVKCAHGCVLLMRGHRTFLVNKGTAEATFNAFAHCAGFGNGSFKMLKDKEAPTVHQVEYILDNHMDTVILNNVPLKLGEVLAEERKKKPKPTSATWCYSTMRCP